MFGSNSAAKENRVSENRSSLKVSFKKSTATSKKPELGLFIILLVLVSGLLVGIYHVYLSEKDISSPIVIDEEGNEALSPERSAKLYKELGEIDNAAQYALIANVAGYYPCFTCPDGSTTIYLYKGEVWKYGTTRKGEQKRYPGKTYGAPNLSFIVQFQGDLSACLKMEKIKIYNYPLLPEATKRAIRLFRPPGNTNDS
jgi:hypothetical protein